MNKQKDVVQEAVEALDKLIRNAPMIKRGQRPENHRLQMTGWLCKVSVAIKEERAALKSSPVDVENAVEVVKQALIGYTTINFIEEDDECGLGLADVLTPSGQNIDKGYEEIIQMSDAIILLFEDYGYRITKEKEDNGLSE